MYRIEELMDLSGASRRQIEEWNRAGFLPAPERPPQAGLNGRGPYYFPDPAPKVARWLKVYRQSKAVKGSDHTKLWLWLEGCDYLDIDIKQLSAAIGASAELVLAAMHSIAPSLPHASDPLLNWDLDNLKDDVSHSALEHRWSGKTEQLVGIVIAAAAGAGNVAQEPVSPLAVLRAIESIQDHSGDHIPVNSIGPDDVPSLTEVMVAFSIPAAIQRRFNIHDARLLWQGVNAFIEHSTNESVSNPWGVFGRYFRRKAFAVDPPLVIFALAVVASFVGKEDVGAFARRYVAKAEKRRTSTRTAARHSPAAS